MKLSLDMPAKVNFWLEVIDKRSDGYHELSTLMLPVGIFDHILVQTKTSGLSLRCDRVDVPGDNRNLAWRAAELYLHESELQTGLHITIEKRIPVAAGLGGGSADAAAVLSLLNRISPQPLPRRNLLRLATRLGADVPFFLSRRPALASGIGEILQEIQGIPDYPLVLIKPPVSVSTADIYARIELTRGRPRIRIASLLAHPWEPRPLMENDLEPITLDLHPELKNIKQWLLDKGALGALMSGSGPTLFGVFAGKEQAREVATEAVSNWPECWVGATEVLVC